MAVKSFLYLNNLVANTERGPTEAIWGSPGTPNAWIPDFQQDPRLGLHVWEEFECSPTPGLFPLLAALTYGSVGKMALLASIGGGVGDAVIIGGGVSLQCGSLAIASTNQDTTMAFSACGAFQISGASSTSGSLQGKLAFEARIALTSVTNGKRDVFVGLCDQTTNSTAALMALVPFTQAGSASNNLTSTLNMIGFYFPSSSSAGIPAGDCVFVYQLASTAPVFASNLKGLISNVGGSAIAAGTYYKLGFVYDQNAGPGLIGTASDGQTVGNTAKAMIRVYVNGVQAAAFLTQTQNILTASFPTGIMGPMAAISPAVSGTSNSGTASAGLLSIDWMRVAQTLRA
jgi:hypothetical protein